MKQEISEQEPKGMEKIKRHPVYSPKRLQKEIEKAKDGNKVAKTSRKVIMTREFLS